MKMHTNRHQEAKLLPPDTFLSRKNAFSAGALALDSAGGAYSAPPGPIAGNGGRAPWEGEGKGEEERGGGRVGRGRVG